MHFSNWTKICLLKFPRSAVQMNLLFITPSKVKMENMIKVATKLLLMFLV